MKSAAESFGFRDEGIEEIVLDSRKTMHQALFVPIIGERSDGHDYIEMAIQNGAVAVLSSRPVAALQQRYPEVRFYEVENTITALQEIGYMERQRFHGPVIGVTGSVGKTTTRTMVAAALAEDDTSGHICGRELAVVCPLVDDTCAVFGLAHQLGILTRPTATSEIRVAVPYPQRD